jgi:hypothetical protein
LAPGRITFPGGLGEHTLLTREAKKTTVSTILDKPPRKVMVNSNRDMGLSGKEAMLYCASTDSADSCPKAELREQRSLTLYTLASRVQRQ